MREQDRNNDVSTNDIFAMLAGDILPSDIHRRRAERARMKVLGRRQNEIEAELDKLHTRELLAMRRWCHDDYVLYGNVLFQPQPGDPFDPFVYALKAVLDRRPHVARGKERQNERRKAATQHHGPKKAGGSKHKQPVKVSARRQWQERKRRFEQAKAIYDEKGYWPTWIAPKPKSIK